MPLTPAEKLERLNNKNNDEYNLDAKAKRVLLVDDTGTPIVIGSSSLRYNDYDEDATYEYYGFSYDADAWMIKRMHKTTNEMRYASGSTGYLTAWADKENQTYAY